MEWRLSDYMIKNGYFDMTVQKGCMREVAACVEHSETIYRAAQDACTHGRDLCVSWIDLANAYGSVKHSLIHFSLKWYHVPDQFCRLMWHYYEGLMASAMVGKLQTGFGLASVFSKDALCQLCSLMLDSIQRSSIWSAMGAQPSNRQSKRP